jgi:hypothetical protein
MPLLENLPTTDLLEAEERIVIDIRYYNELDEVIPVSASVHRMDVTIRNSIYLRTVTESYADEAPYGEGEHPEFEMNNSTVVSNAALYSTKIEKRDYGSFSEILLSLLKTKAKSISVRMETDSKTIEIEEKVIGYILSNFDTIYLNFSGINRWISLPEINANINYLCIENSNLIVKQIILSCETSFILRNCTIMSDGTSNNYPGFLVTIGSDSTLSNIRIASKVFIGISGKDAKDINRWSKTSITVSDFFVGFEDTSRNEKTNTGFYDAILTLAEVADIRISGLSSLNDIPYYPLLSAKKFNEANIGDISRASRNLPSAAPGIQLGEYFNVAIANLTYIGVSKTLDSSAFIRFSSVRIDSSISLLGANIVNMALLNLAGISCQQIDISNSVLKNSMVLNRIGTSSIGKLILSNVTMETDKLFIKALSLSILGSTDIETKEEIRFELSDSSNISDSKIKSNGMFKIILGPDASVHITNSFLTSQNELNIHTEKDLEEPLSSNISFNKVSLSSRKMVFNLFNSLRFEETELLSSDLSVAACNSILFGIMAQYRASPLPIMVRDSVIRDSLFTIYSPGSNQVFNFSGCIGRFRVQYLDDSNPKATCKLFINGSPLNIHFDAVTDRKVYVNSEKSLGAVITGESGAVTIIPDIESVDRVHFEKVNENAIKKDDKIIYGTLTS